MMKKNNKKFLNYFLTIVYNVIFLLFLIGLILLTKNIFVNKDITKNIKETKDIIRDIDSTLNDSNYIIIYKDVYLKEPISDFLNVKDYYLIVNNNISYLTLTLNESLFKYDNYILSKNYVIGDLVLVNESGKLIEGYYVVKENKSYLKILNLYNQNLITEIDLNMSMIKGKIILKN